MIKLIIFDLDGTLINSTKELHFKALNQALSEVSPEYIISSNEHESKFDALSTKQKLELLTRDKGLSENLHLTISTRKQEITFELLKQESFNIDHSKLMQYVRKKRIKIALCTNSIRKTTDIIIDKLGIEDFIDLVLTNEDVIVSKPDPEIFLKAMDHFGVTPDETLIFEDSNYGIDAAIQSGAIVRKIEDVIELTTRKISWLLRGIETFRYLFNTKGIQKVISSNGGDFLLLVKCPKCGKERFRYVNNIKRVEFTGECNICSARKAFDPNKIDKSGYRLISLFTLNEMDEGLCIPMVNKANCIREHRLVMARHLNRPLKDYEIVHHKNGNKADNRLENLELLNTKSHHNGHGDVYYQKWQEALSIIEQLKRAA